jgi:dolichol-phosphate hexosyltransferase
MYKGQTVGIIMPGRNIAHILEKQLSFIPDCVDEIILVSNRSKDSTLATAQELASKFPKLKVVQDDRADSAGIGYGYAIMTGISKATTDLVFKIDVDCTYPVEILPQVLDFLMANNLDFVSCNRHPTLSPNKAPMFISLGVWVLNLETRILFGRHIKDIISGMYGGKVKTVQNLRLEEGGWNLSVEIKLKTLTSKQIRFDEYFIVQHPPQTPSHQNYLRTGLNHLWFIFTTRLKTWFKKYENLDSNQLLPAEDIGSSRNH